VLEAMMGWVTKARRTYPEGLADRERQSPDTLDITAASGGAADVMNLLHEQRIVGELETCQSG
jgi:hypothetical protein